MSGGDASTCHGSTAATMPSKPTSAPEPTTCANSKTSSSGWPGARSWSSTRAATPPSNPKGSAFSFQIVSSRYERASLIVTSNKPFGRGEVLGDEMIPAAAMIRPARPRRRNHPPQGRQSPAQGPRPRPRHPATTDDGPAGVST